MGSQAARAWPRMNSQTLIDDQSGCGQGRSPCLDTWAGTCVRAGRKTASPRKAYFIFSSARKSCGAFIVGRVVIWCRRACADHIFRLCAVELQPYPPGRGQEGKEVAQHHPHRQHLLSSTHGGNERHAHPFRGQRCMGQRLRVRGPEAGNMVVGAVGADSCHVVEVGVTGYPVAGARHFRLVQSV